MDMRLILASIFNSFDLLVTAILIALFGLNIETNPFGVYLFSDSNLLLVYKVLLVNLLLVVLHLFRKKKIAKVGTNIVFGAYLALTIYHLYIIVEVVKIYIK